MIDDAITSFMHEIATEVEETISNEQPFSQEIFTSLILERLEEAGHLDVAIPLYQEGRIRNSSYRIDGYSYDEDRGRLDLFSTIYSGDLSASKLTAADINRAFERAIRFASACVEGLAKQLEPANTDASDLARLIEDSVEKISIVRVVLITDGIVGSFSPGNDWRGKKVEFEVYDRSRLFRILGQGETRSDITVDLEALTGKPLSCLKIPSDDGEYEAFLSVLPGEVLAQIYERYGVRLLELNVRAFLGLQGRKSVNAELRKTIADEPAMFLAFNNGIVATVDDIEIERGELGGDEIKKLKGLQIVNGGQTTASLHRARRKDGLKLEKVLVPIKIIKVCSADLTKMVSSVSRAANRQNAVQLADFSANDPFHQQIEALAASTWLNDGKGRWFYERTRGSYGAAEQKAAYRKTDIKLFRSQTPKSRRFSKLDVARYVSAWSGLPDKVCWGGQKNFQYFMQRLKDEPPPPPDQAWFKKLIATAVLYRCAERKVRSMKFPAYGAQIVAYVVASISHRSGGRIDFERIWNSQSVSSELERLIGDWATVLDILMRTSAGKRNPSEWFKKVECWKEIQALLPMFSDPLPPELSFSASKTSSDVTERIVQGEHSVADYDRIARCMAINSATWMEVAERGQKAGAIHWKVAGICRTLAGYAAGGWDRKPSPKQAKHALDAVLAVEKVGLISASDTVLS